MAVAIHAVRNGGNTPYIYTAEILLIYKEYISQTESNRTCIDWKCWARKKNQQQPCISVNLTFLFSPVHVSTCIMPPKQQTIFLPLSTPKWNKMKKQLPKIRKSMLTFLSGSLSADKVTHFMKHEPEVARLLSEKTGSLCHILTSSLKHTPNSMN